jgi:hypothetical protein
MVSRSDPDAPIAIERDGVELTLRAGSGHRTCPVRALEGFVGLAFGLDEGARLSALRVERR